MNPRFKLLLSAVALFGTGFLLLADSTNDCGEYEPLPADYTYQLSCQGPEASQQVSVQGMFVRQSDDDKLRNEGMEVAPSSVTADVTPSVVWDTYECSAGEGIGHVDGIEVIAELSTSKAGAIMVVCDGPRASLMGLKANDLACKVKAADAAAPSSSASGSYEPKNNPPNSDDAGTTDAGASDGGASDDGPSSWSQLICKLTLKPAAAK